MSRTSPGQRSGLCGVVVWQERRVDRLGRPVEHHIRQQLVLREPTIDVAVAIAPAAKLLDDPGGEPRGRIIESDRGDLRLRPLYERIRALLLLKPGNGIQVLPPGARRIVCLLECMEERYVGEVDGDDMLAIEVASRTVATVVAG